MNKPLPRDLEDLLVNVLLNSSNPSRIYISSRDKLFL